ncbi:hypothetical protein HII12_004734 [Brettanomyces bruxellensis]|uniref:Major facilitator superfamily (MFS) profile domain-containing protein n=1 Tax=Dekkera bruxellensis TaxID=5007 RepID=A0A8H6B9C2_DEKBR|nr:hypothetical protein HII12_004734 [Brettanomyces bruxellensis]
MGDISDSDEDSVEIDDLKANHDHIENAAPDDIDDKIISKFLGASDEVKESEKQEKDMGFKEAIKTYPKCAIWSVVLSTGLIMEGYDTCLLSSMYALPIFCEKFGTWDSKSKVWEISAGWQTGLSMCVNVGEIIDKFGYRYTLIGSMVVLAGFIFLLFFAKSCVMIAVGQVLCGIPWGFFQTLAVSYASEVCPLALRYYLTSYVNVCWVFGQLFASGIMKNSQEAMAHTDMGWRLPFALMWIWPVPISVGIFFAPESPWWLIKKNRMNEAAHSLKRLLTIHEKDRRDLIIGAMVKRMKFTSDKEDTNGETGTYMECFSRKNIRRTRIACMTWVGQNACGSCLMGYSTYFYEKAGMSTSAAFDFSIIMYCLGIIGAFASWIISHSIGRATIYIGGMGIQTILMWVTGILGFIKQTSAVGWAVGSLLLVFTLVYDSTVGPERSEQKLWSLQGISTIFGGIFNAVITPYQLNSTQWNWGAKTGIFWAVLSTLIFVWSVFDLPETKDRTFAEIDQLFEDHVSARKFRSTDVDPFNDAKLLKQFDKKKLHELGNIDVGEHDTEDIKELE